MDPKEPDIEIEMAEPTEDSVFEIYDLLIKLHAEGGYSKLDHDKALENAYLVINEGMCFTARHNGILVGTLALTELSFWYSRETFLQDAWFFVLPSYRFGQVGVKLMNAAKIAGDELNKIVFITVNNPDRKPKSTRMTTWSQVAGYVPLGHTVRLN